MNRYFDKYTAYLLTIGVLFIGFSYYRGLGGTLYDLFLILGICFWVITGCPGFRAQYVLNWTMLGVAVSLFGFVISTVESSNPLDSLVQLSKFCFSVFVFFIIFPSVFSKKKYLIFLLRVLAISGAVNGLGSILQIFVGLAPLGDLPVLGRMTGFTEHPNELGFHCAMSSFVAFYFFRSSENYYSKFIYSIILSLAFSGVVLSASITALASVFAAICCVFILEYKDGNYRVVKEMIFVFSIAAILVLFLAVFGEENNIVNRVFAQKDLSSDEGTLGARFVTYELAVERILDNPFVGVGNSEDDTLSVIGDYVHNIFLRAFREGGVFSFIGMVIIFYRVFYGCLKTRSISIDFRNLGTYIIGLMLLVVIGVSFGPAFFQRIVWLPFGVGFSFIWYARYSKD